MTSPDSPALTVADLTVQYPSSPHRALDGINLTIHAGEVVLLTGPSGCGKSTLMGAIRGLIPSMYPAEMQGSVQVGGAAIANRSVADLARDVGLVIQEPLLQLCNLTVEHEVAFGIENLGLEPEVCRKRVAESLALVGLSGKVSHDVQTLSGGECQKLAIASVVAMQSPVVLLDEPTAMLDPAAAAEVRELILRLREEGRAVLIVQHDLDELLPLCDRMIVLDAGRITDDGVPEQVVTRLATSGQIVGVPAVSQLAMRLGVLEGNGTVPLTAERLATLLLTAHPAVDPITNATPAVEDGQPVVTMSGVRYRHDRADRDSVSVPQTCWKRGEVVALVGRNGSGKSTLGKLVAGLLDPSAGEVKVEGIERRQTRRGRQAPRTGYVFQFPEHQFVASTVVDEIMYGLIAEGRDRKESHDLAVDIAKRLGLGEVLQSHPFALSGGQKRRLSVATMLVLQPRVLVLDEPTYGLDNDRLDELVELIFRVLRDQGSTIVVITHDLQLAAAYCDRIVLLADGHIVGDGTPAHIYGSDSLASAQLPEPPLAQLRNTLVVAGWPLSDVPLSLDELGSYISTLLRSAA